MSPERNDDGRGALSSSRLARGLPARLRRLLREGAPPSARPRTSPPARREGARNRHHDRGLPLREAEREGRLLVFRERFEDTGWRDGPGAALFGRDDAPSRMHEVLRRRGVDGKALAFVDIETCGLADRPVFLVGILGGGDGRSWELVQYLAPDPCAEPELLRRTAGHLVARPEWVSFNGRSFDVPRMRARCRLHGIEWPACRDHRDLLHDVRRRWKSRLPDCRLTTVEARLLRIERLSGDVPGREVPERYHDFVRSGERRWLEPVIEHNRRDVAALASLLLRVLEP